MQRPLLFFGIFLLGLTAKAQNFDYTITKDSVAWQELNTQTILNTNNSPWYFFYKIPIGFKFNYLGHDWDTIRLETNGYLVFDPDRYYTFNCFNGFYDCLDADSVHSVLGYQLSGDSGSRVLKIQFKRTSNFLAGAQYFTYQVWIRENGTIEVHVGPNDYQPYIVVNVVQVDIDSFRNDTFCINCDSSQLYRVGLINMFFNTPISGLYIGGTLDNPYSQPVDENHPSPIGFFTAPRQGTRFTFTPNY